MVIKFLKYRVKIETGFILPRRTQVKGCKKKIGCLWVRDRETG